MTLDERREELARLRKIMVVLHGEEACKALEGLAEKMAEKLIGRGCEEEVWVATRRVEKELGTEVAERIEKINKEHMENGVEGLEGFYGV